MSAVSVVVPLLNKGPHIKRALESVMNQSIQNFEIIVIDGGSTDEGPDIVQNYQDLRIKFIRQDPQRPGVSSARNVGITEAKNDFVAFLDADDEWMPTHLETLLELRVRFPEAGLYCTNYKFGGKRRGLKDAKIKGIPESPCECIIPNYFITVSLGDTPSWTSVVGVPKEIVNRVGGFPEGIWYGEDTYLWCIIALEYPIAFSWKCEAIYHYDSINRAGDKIPPLNQELIVKELNKRLDSNQIPEHLIDDVNEYIVRKELMRAMNCIYYGELKKAKKIALECHTKLNKRRLWILKVYCIFPEKISTTLKKLIKKLKKSNIKPRL